MLVGTTTDKRARAVRQLGYNYINGEGVYGLLLEDKGVFGVYADVDRLTRSSRVNTALAAALISGRLTHDLSGNTNNLRDYYAVSPRLIGLEWYGTKFSIDSEQLVTDKISSWHHSHLRLRDLAKCDRHDGIYTYTFNNLEAFIMRRLLPLTNNEVTLTTFLTYIRVCPDWCARLLATMVALSDTLDQLTTILKELSQTAKQTQHIYRDDLSYIFELNVLINRVQGDVDWDKELRNRTDEMQLAQPDIRQIYKDAYQLFSDAISTGRKPIKMSWRDYDAQRWAMAPGGTIHDSSGLITPYIKAIHSEYRTKFTVYSHMPDTDLDEWTSAPPEIHARPSTKYEWGKVRALYGCDAISHKITDFAFAGAEDALPQFMPTGAAATEHNVTRMLMAMKGGVPFCYDYDDFNSQHSTDAMHAVLEAWISANTPLLHDDQVKAARWVSQSVFRQYIDMPDVQVPVRGTLFSGWRLTSFMNTVLNYLYLKQAGLDELSFHSVHNGDDVFAITNTLGDALKIVNNGKSISLRAQVSKMNIGTISEFLRMDINTKLPTTKQYLSRAVATAVHSRIETGPPTDVMAHLTAHHDRMSALVVRGGDRDTVDAISSRILSVMSRRYGLNMGELYSKYLQLHKVQGGAQDVARVSSRKIEKYSAGLINTRAAAVSELMRNGILSYKKYLEGKLKFTDNYGEQILINETNRILGVHVTKARLVAANVHDDRIKIGLYRAYANTEGMINIAKARHITRNLALVAYLFNTTLATFLSKCDNPIQWLNILV